MNNNNNDRREELSKMTHAQLRKEASTVLTRLANKETVNGIYSPNSFTVNKPNGIKIIGSSLKTEKGEKLNVLTIVAFLAPSDSSGLLKNGKPLNVCAFATDACRTGCLGLNAGLMVAPQVINSKLWKTALYYVDKELFRALIIHEIAIKEKYAMKQGFNKLGVRLNGTSDLPFYQQWPELLTMFPNVQFYDYTKQPALIKRYDKNETPNYHLTYSANGSEHSQEIARIAHSKGLSISAIVRDTLTNESEEENLAHNVLGFNTNVVDGDDTDVRFYDRPGSIVALRLKANNKTKVAELLNNDIFEV